MRMMWLLLSLVLAGCASDGGTHPAQAQTQAHRPASVLEIHAEQLHAAYWIARQPHPHTLRLSADDIAQQNARVYAQDTSVRDLATLPDTLTRDAVKATIEALSAPPTRMLFDAQGQAITPSQLDAFADALALDRLPHTITPQFALVTRRADLRTFPTAQRVFRTSDDVDIDRFQESALFPGTPVAILHRSRDGAWSFVESPLYRAWIASDALAFGARDTVLGYATRAPQLIVTGATARTVFTREPSQLSDLQLDMGVRVPLLADWPADLAVNGQHPGGAYVIELPTHDAQGALQLRAALLPRSADVSQDVLPLTDAHLLQQAFKFLGERYGWGHADDTRDCSGFVAEIHRAFGIVLPRNTSDQARSPALQRIEFTAADDHDVRRAVIRALDVGDLIYIPGHVMMVIGHERDATFVIHDVAGVRVRGPDGVPTRVTINAVAVTPLDLLLADDDTPLIDRITNIVRHASHASAARPVDVSPE